MNPLGNTSKKVKKEVCWYELVSEYIPYHLGCPVEIHE